MRCGADEGVELLGQLIPYVGGDVGLHAQIEMCDRVEWYGVEKGCRKGIEGCTGKREALESREEDAKGFVRVVLVDLLYRYSQINNGRRQAS